MTFSTDSFIRATFLLILPAIALTLAVSICNAQTTTSAASGQQEVAKASSENPDTAMRAANAPVFTDYRGIRIGMTANEVRNKLDGIKEGKFQDLFSVSDKESAQIYYDKSNKVMAISVDYIGDNDNAPSPETVLGASIQAKPDGSMYQLKRYPDAGYWVSYNRTAGNKPIVSITMQKLER
jgi:hypothetical protein